MPPVPSPSSPSFPLEAILLAAVDGFGAAQLRAVREVLGDRPLCELDAALLTTARVAPSLHQAVLGVLQDTEQQAHWQQRIEVALGAEGRLLGSDEVAVLPGLSALADCPPFLAANPRLDPELLGQPRVGIVGTREASAEALRWTQQLAAELARQRIVVVSGGARGIDSAAHQGAVDAAGQTLCVLGGSFDQERLERPDHLAWLWQHALVLSEVYFSTPILKWMYPRRNRLVAALSQVLLVVQGRARSGAGITADWATRLGRPVLARPGSVDDARASLPNTLLAAGARAVLGVDDVRRALEAASGGPSTPAPEQQELVAGASARRTRSSRRGSRHGDGGGSTGSVSADGWRESLDPATGSVWQALLAEPAGVLLDALAARTSLGPTQLASALLTLELAGRIRREPGPRIVAVDR